MFKAGIIGYGRSGRQLHGAALKACNAFEVTAVSGIPQATLDAAVEDFGCEVFADYKEMLNSCDLDVVVIVTRNDQHKEMAIDCLNAGKAVLVTKPMGISTAEVESIEKVSQETGIQAFPFMPARWGSDVMKIKELIDAGTIGEVFAIRRAAYGFATRDDWQTRKEFGGGILLNWGAHLIDTPIWLSGGSVSSVFGSTSQVLNPGDTEDNYYAVLQMDNGVRIHSEWSFLPEGLPNWVVQGTKGAIIAYDQELTVHSGEPVKPTDPTDFKAMEGGGITKEVITVNEHIYGSGVEIYDDLAKAMSKEISFKSEISDALQLARVIDAIKSSQETQTIIRL